ncbi:hypothetical protein ATG98_1257 [Marinobacter sp. LV10R520-4]|uniref:hypothetical protein n=1 Tax=Marinobacter sp. LV10R520-4 TaxID=1761796 RepID=UPI000BF7FB43|nr:hypothetical protein [Marinobacter sp. LV10R520-4]PFG52249.1 hypothetical protein ATG98_1257 [Marinobacter sp. LV10R520-4]
MRLKRVLLPALLLACSNAMALPTFMTSGDLSVDGCAYGRSTMAVDDATANALQELASFLSSPKLFTESTANEELDTATSTWLQELRDMSVEGLQLQRMPVTTSSPRIQGNDTCVTVTLVRGTLPGNQSNGDSGRWESGTPEVTVTVTGEGWPDKSRSLTARNQAELDALKRAVSQVVGVWLTQQRAQFSTMEERASGSSSSIALNDMISQQLYTRSEGLVKEWKTLNFRDLENGGIEVTIQAVVEKQLLATAANDVLTAIGSPRVAVVGPQAVAGPLKAWLNTNGVEVSQSASLRIVANAQLKARGNTRRLALTVTVEDLSGQQYGLWRNDPSLLALPASDTVQTDLIDVHLALPAQQKSLRAELQQAFQSMVAQGGLLREIRLRKGLLREPDKLQALLATLGGARDVAVSSNGNYHQASLRYAGATGDLVSAIRQSLRPIAAEPLPQANISNGYEITFN